MPVITLTTKEWEHETTITYPFKDIHDNGAPAAVEPSDFKEYRCGSCGKIFRIAFLAGVPYFWDESTEHEQPMAVDFRWHSND